MTHCLIGPLFAAVLGATPPADLASGQSGAPEGATVFVEAEVFTADGEGWMANKPLYAPRDETIPSGMQGLYGKGAGEGQAQTTLDVPEEGDYRLWLRFAQWAVADEAKRGPFKVTVTQGSQAMFEQVYDQTFEGKPIAGNFHALTWQPADVSLKAGKAQVVISKVGKASTAAGSRYIDCLLLTKDTDYQPNHRDFAPPTWVRFRLQRSTPEELNFYSFANHERRPYYANLNFSPDGFFISPVVPGITQMKAGQDTGWINFSRLLYTDTDTMFTFQATVNFHRPDASDSAYAIDFATEPNESSIVKTVTRDGPGAGLMVRVPPDLTDGKLPKADYEYAGERAALLAKLPRIDFGKRPVKFPLIVGVTANDARSSPQTREFERQAMTFLGVNGVSNTLDDKDIASGLLFRVDHGNVWYGDWLRGVMPREKVWEKMQQGVDAIVKKHAEKPHPERGVELIIFDEARGRALKAMADHEEEQAGFVAWLKDKGLTPSDLGVGDWSQVTITPDRETPYPALYFYSQRYRAWAVADFFARATSMLPEGTPTSMNFSDIPVYIANMYNNGNDYYEWYAANTATNVARGEDWSNGQATNQLAGWNVALLRAATRKDKQPIHMYDITAFNRRAVDVKLKAYTDMAQGAKLLEFYAYSPLYNNHEHGWARNWEMFPAVAELAHEIGAAEDVLIDAMPVKAQTAIIYSRAYDIWSVSVNNAFGQERMLTYLALRHAQVPVDAVYDTDISAGGSGGGLDGYKVAFLHGEQIERAMVEPLIAFVNSGGTLVLGPGAGSRDEFNQPMDTLDKGLGLNRGELTWPQSFRNVSVYIDRDLRSKDKVNLADGQAIDLFTARQTFDAKAAGAKTLATYESDQAPAAVSRSVGKGRVLAVGFCPALAYMHEGLARFHAVDDEQMVDLLPQFGRALDQAEAMGLEIPAHLHQPVMRQYYAKNAFDYPATPRDFIVAPALDAGVAQPVAVDTPVVEATMLEGEEGWAVLLANYTGPPLKNIEVTFKPSRAIGEIHSSRHGKMKPTTGEQATYRVSMPLETTDILYGKWK